MFGFGKKRKMDEMASHMATLMNLKLIGLKPTIGGPLPEAICKDPYILGWAYGLSATSSHINGWRAEDRGFMQFRLYDALFGSEEYAELAANFAMNKDPDFISAMNAAIKEYRPIYELIQTGADFVPNKDYFPSLTAYVDSLA